MLLPVPYGVLHIWEPQQPQPAAIMHSVATLASEHARFAPLDAGCAATPEEEQGHHHQHEFHDESSQQDCTDGI